jgi:hypothetical protein
MPPIKQ